jgi:uncharacterized protein YecT (DUF1311 family)
MIRSFASSCDRADIRSFGSTTGVTKGATNRVRTLYVLGTTLGLLTAILVGAFLSTPRASADPVGECQASTGNQVETTQCLSDTLGAAQQVLATEFQRAQNKADSLDQVTGRAVARHALDQSQAEWQKFRDANCAVRFAFAAGASGAGQFQASCEIEMTRARTDELSSLAAGG